MAMRRYSVSSSPLAPGADPSVVTATVGQVKFTTGTGRRGTDEMVHYGLASTVLGQLPEKELQAHLESGALSTLHVAFSREAGVDVWRVLSHPKSVVFICGDARSMAPDVKRSFQRVIENCGGRSNSSAANLLASMVEAVPAMVLLKEVVCSWFPWISQCFPTVFLWFFLC
eukprot:Skav234233  [mRNA]  locus=scaffold1464:336173:338412:+ [translate_table: standard]